MIIDSKCSKKNLNQYFNIIKTNLFLFNQSVSDLKNDNFNNKKFNDKNEVKLKIEIEESNTTSRSNFKINRNCIKINFRKTIWLGNKQLFSSTPKIFR